MLNAWPWLVVAWLASMSLPALSAAPEPKSGSAKSSLKAATPAAHAASAGVSPAASAALTASATLAVALASASGVAPDCNCAAPVAAAASDPMAALRPGVLALARWLVMGLFALALVLALWGLWLARHTGLSMRSHWGGFGGEEGGWWLPPPMVPLLGAAILLAAGLLVMTELLQATRPPQAPADAAKPAATPPADTAKKS